MSNITIDDVFKKVNKKYGEVLKIGVDETKEDEYISLGSPGFDFCLYAGLQKYRIHEFSGPESAGKTTAGFFCCASYQREQEELGSDKKVLWVDNEHTLDPIWAAKQGFDTSKAIIFRPEALSAEDVLDVIVDFIKTGQVGLIVLDSVTTLVPKQLIEESMEKRSFGGIAIPLTRFVNTIIGLLKKHECTFIGIQQIRQNLSGYGDPIVIGGGQAWKHACTTRLLFKRGDFFNEEGERIRKKDANSPTGQYIQVYVMKTKQCNWDRKLGEMKLDYDKGIDYVADTIDIATYFDIIVDKGVGRYEIIDLETGEIIKKIHGKTKLNNYFRENKEAFLPLYNKVYEMLRKKDDPHIKSLEEILGVNVAFLNDMNEEIKI